MYQSLCVGIIILIALKIQSMKKPLFLCLAVFCVTFSHAQIFNPFKVDQAVGGAIPNGSGAKGGVLFSLEPKYAVISRLSVGVRIEAAIMARGYVSSDGSTASANVSAAASYIATSDYYYTNSVFRPFTGVGAGLYRFASASIESSGNKVGTTAGSRFGTMVRSGFEVGHFRFAVEYNIIGKNTQTYTDASSGNKYTVTSRNSYMGVKLGFFFGGGRIGSDKSVASPIKM
jgi:outer membrane protein X